MEMTFGRYLVIQEKKDFNAIYKKEYAASPKEFVLHKTSWRQATKIAKLLNDTYLEGFEDAKEQYKEDYYRY